jgi:hypothetical protein
MHFLQSEYDADVYAQMIRHYGTHYVAAATLGGQGSMRTTIAQSFFSTNTDATIDAQLSGEWGQFGGGASGGASSNATSTSWNNNTYSVTYTEGGDPAIKSFNSDAEWTHDAVGAVRRYWRTCHHFSCLSGLSSLIRLRWTT